MERIIEKTPSFVRWALMLPLAIVCALLFRSLLIAINGFAMRFSYLDPGNAFVVMHRFFIEVVVADIVFGASLILVPMYLAPKGKNIVGVIFLCLFVSFLSISSILAVLTGIGKSISFWLSMASGLLGAIIALIFYSLSIKESKHNLK